MPNRVENEEDSSSSSTENYPPYLTPSRLHHIQTEFTDYALSHGNIVRQEASASPLLANLNPNNAFAVHTPCTLFPSVFPRKSFEEAKQITPIYNRLYSEIIGDELWLGFIVNELVRVDDFIGNLWKCWEEVKKVGIVQDLSLGLFRSDYMIHVNPSIPNSESVIYQVEFNTIASSFGALASRTSELHRHLHRIRAYPEHSILSESSLPPSSALHEVASGLASAHKAYGAPATSAKQLGIIFLVQSGERNTFDQRWLEYSLLEHYGIMVYRLSFDDIPYYTRLDDKTRALLYTPPHLHHCQITMTEVEITTVYFRSGYGPADYPTSSHWEYRKIIEMSRAIKCPTILTQLAGSKKVQQVLCHPGVLERFLPSQDAERIRKTFANIYPLDGSSPEGLRARELALNPETAKKHVLKPQREGGGNNIYREKIPMFLNSIPEETWSSYILMELIEPPPLKNIIVRNGEVVNALLKSKYSHEALDIRSNKKVDYGIPVIGELGIFGVSLWKTINEGTDKKVQILVNKEAGYLLRTKSRESEEGGVAAGYGYIDSAVLVDNFTGIISGEF